MSFIEIIQVFTDAATSPPHKVAVGVYLFLTNSQREEYLRGETTLISKLTNKIMYFEYLSKKSTWSELQTVLDALEKLKEIYPLIKCVELYTDCQTVCDLLTRRKERLIKNNFKSKSGKELENAEQYKKLFEFDNYFQLKAFKMKGHQPKNSITTLEQKIFTVLDKVSRQKLRAKLGSVDL